MDKQTKLELSGALRSQIEDLTALVLIEFQGISVAAADDLRNRFRDAGCSYRVYKNSTINYAVEGTKHEAIRPLLKGTSGLAFHADDPGAPARVVRDFAKENDKVQLKGAVVDGDMLEGARALALADMPGPQELKAKLLALFSTPATNMVRVLNAPVRDLLNVFNAKKNKDAA